MHIKIQGFIDFIKEQGVVGLAVGFVLGGAVAKIVSSLVDNIINPIVGFLLGRVTLGNLVLHVSDSVVLEYGAFISSVIDFCIVAIIVYITIKSLGLDKKK